MAVEFNLNYSVISAVYIHEFIGSSVHIIKQTLFTAYNEFAVSQTLHLFQIATQTHHFISHRYGLALDFLIVMNPDLKKNILGLYIRFTDITIHPHLG